MMNRKGFLGILVVALSLAGCVNAPKTTEPFRIVSYNIRHGWGMDGTTSVWRVACAIAGESPRFAGVQEVDQKTKRVDGLDSCAKLRKATKMHVTFAKGIDFQGGEYGVAVLSREVPLSVRRIPLPGEEPRVLLLCEFDDCWFGTTHLDVTSPEAREKSVSIIREAVADCGAKPVFLTGDWNANPDSPVLAGLKDFMTVLSGENEGTFHGGKELDLKDPRRHCIDYVAVNSACRKDYRVRGRRVIANRVASDHLPIVVEVSPAVNPEIKDEAFKLATFNVRCPGDRGDNTWYRRMPRVAQVIRDNDIAVFGVQEAVREEVRILEEELRGFSYVGCGRNEDRGGESMLIFYNRTRFACLEDGTFWLSETPDKPGSKYTGAGCPRTCTWALLQDRITGRRFRYFNTHLDHISSQARRNGMQVLLERGVRPAKARGETVILTGDLNETLDKADDPKAIAALCGPRLASAAKENPIALLSTELKDTYALSETPHTGTFRTFHGYRAEPKCRIDYVFVTPDVRVLTHATLNDRPDGKFPSDHDPVAVTLDLSPRSATTGS